MSRPAYLYKYRPLNNDCDLSKDYGLDALKKNSQWFSKPEAFNDPFDCQLKVAIDNQYFTSLPLYVNSIGVNNVNVVGITNIIQQCKVQGMNDEQTISVIESALITQGVQSLRS